MVEGVAYTLKTYAGALRGLCLHNLVRRRLNKETRSHPSCLVRNSLAEVNLHALKECLNGKAPPDVEMSFLSYFCRIVRLDNTRRGGLLIGG